MPKDENTSSLKLIHLVWMVLALAVGVGTAWGTIKNQQKTNTANIEKKVEKEVFQMYMTQQKVQYDGIDKKLDQLIEEK